MNISDIVMKYARVVAIIVAAAAFTYASYSFTKSYIDYQVGDASYDDINDMFQQQVNSDNDSNNNSDLQNDDNSTADTVVLTNEVSQWVWNFDSMKEYNSDSLGYIKQDNSRIQYPILQYENNEYYLTHGADRAYNGNGAIFVDYRCNEGLESDNCIIYGHNMRSGSMFASLLNYSDEKYYKQNPTFDIYIGYKHYIYYVFAVATAPAVNGFVYQVDFETNEDYEEWLDKCIKASIYETDITKLDTSDKIITLSTCTNSDSSKRFIVQLVRGEQVID
ncbi:MAG: class B sortase [Eubacterium sp.]